MWTPTGLGIGTCCKHSPASLQELACVWRWPGKGKAVSFVMGHGVCCGLVDKLWIIEFHDTLSMRAIIMVFAHISSIKCLASAGPGMRRFRSAPLVWMWHFSVYCFAGACLQTTCSSTPAVTEAGISCRLANRQLILARGAALPELCAFHQMFISNLHT